MFVASTYGRVIISEMTLPETSKSIKSVQVGGIAGGRKYIAQGSFWNFNPSFSFILFILLNSFLYFPKIRF